VDRDELERAPEHLSEAAQDFWRDIVDTWELGPADFRTLAAALEAWDRCRECRRIIDEAGLMITDRFGAPKEHPLANKEIAHRASFLRAMRELDLAGEPRAEFRAPRGRRYH
jgi:P27 family predicted phage terminase small subunit